MLASFSAEMSMVHKKYPCFARFLFLAAYCFTWGNFLSSQTQHGTPHTTSSLIIFSFDRPLQCEGLLATLEKHVTGLESVSVLYRTSSSTYDKAYECCFKNFTKYPLSLIKQGSSPREDFKPLLLSLLKNLKTDYVLFAVDDILIKGPIDLQECAQLLTSFNAYGFHLRLGKNTTYCYSAQVDSPLPPYKQINATTIAWNLNQGTAEWRYLNSLDMVLYRRNKVVNDFEQLRFHSPNTLEAAWANHGFSNGDLNNLALCYNESKIINIPLNLVQGDWKTAINMGYSLKELLELFELGYRINSSIYQTIDNIAPHMEIKPFLYKSMKACQSH
jgi:hypothetical protein